MNLRISYVKTLSVGVRAVIVAGVVCHLLTSTASAQGNDNQGNPAILAAVHNLEDAVIGLQNTVNDVQLKVNALGALTEGNVRITPPVNVNGERGESANCQLANVSSVARLLRIQLINSSGVTLTEQTISIPAGHSFANGQTSAGLSTVYCKLTAVDGTRSDIRGAIVLFNLPPGGPRFSLPAE